MVDQSDLAAGKKRILIVIGTLAIGGGAEKVAASVGSGLVAEGYDIHLLTFYETEHKYPFSGIYATLGEPIIYNRLKKIWRLPKRIFKLWQYVKQNDIAVAVSFLEEANFYTLIMKLCLARHLPVIVSVRNNLNQRGFVFRYLSRLLYPYANRVVSVTKAVEHVLRTTYKLTNTVTIYNPLDTSLITQRLGESLPDERQWLKEKRPLCITIGRLTHQKGQWHLLRAFTEVLKTQPTARLVVLGEGEYREKIERLITACDLEGKVYLLGNDENVYRYLAVADLFVFSSLWEGMPNTVLEAMAVELPIVSTDCLSGPREIIAPTVGISEAITYPHETSTGMLVAPLTHEVIWVGPDVVPLTAGEQQLAAAITKCLSMPLASSRNRGLPMFSDQRFLKANIVNEWRREIDVCLKS